VQIKNPVPVREILTNRLKQKKYNIKNGEALENSEKPATVPFVSQTYLRRPKKNLNIW
jgi:hypothetical protein